MVDAVLGEGAGYFRPGLLESVLCASFGTCSVIGSMLIVVSYLLFEQLRSSWRRLLVWLSVFDLIQGVFYVSVATPLYGDISPAACTLIGVLNIYSCAGAYLCTACLAYMVNDIISVRSTKQSTLASKIMHFIFLGYPTAVTAFVLVVQYTDGMNVAQKSVISTDNDQFGCWINKQHQLLRWLAAYIPLILSWCVTVYFHIKSYRHLASVTRSPSFTKLLEEGGGNDGVSRTITNVMRRLSLVPLGFAILRLPDMLFRVGEIFSWGLQPAEGPGRWLTVAQSVLNPSQGFWNAILFVLYSESVRQGLVGWCLCRRGIEKM
eukprot:g5145.t1